MLTPQYCPYCFEEIERTRYWYRNAPEIDSPVRHVNEPGVAAVELVDPMAGVEEMVMVFPCRHSFETDAWDEYTDACEAYTTALETLSQAFNSPAAESYAVDLNDHDLALHVQTETCCETMERTPPAGVFDDV